MPKAQQLHDHHPERGAVAGPVDHDVIDIRSLQLELIGHPSGIDDGVGPRNLVKIVG